MQLLKRFKSTHTNMDITKSIQEFFSLCYIFLDPGLGKTKIPTTPTFIKHPTSLSCLRPGVGAISTSPSYHYPNIPKPRKPTSHFDNIASEMLQSSLQALHPSRAPPPSPVIDLESQLPESQAQPSVTIYNQELSRTQETQPLHFTAVDTEILLRTAQSEAPQPHSTMEVELQ